MLMSQQFESYFLLQCGRAFDPNFLFLWPNARVSMTVPGHAASLLPPDSEQQQQQEEEEQQKKKREQEEKFNRRLKEESSAFFSSGRLWDDGVILPQDTRKVKINPAAGTGINSAQALLFL